MRKIDELGLFWLHGHPEDRLSGRLRLDPTGGIDLALVGAFGHAQDLNGEPAERILGWLGTDRVTLDQAFLTFNSRPSSGVSETRYRVNRLFIGHQFEAGELAFKTVRVAISDLDSWVETSGITYHWNHESDRPDVSRLKYEMNFVPPQTETHLFSRGRLSIAYSWKEDGDPIHGIAFKQWPIIKIEYDELQPFRVIQKDVGRIQSLVTLCIDERTTVDALVLNRPDVRTRFLSGDDAGEQAIEFLAPLLRYIDPAERKPRHRFEMLVGYKELGGIAAIARWLDASERFQRPLDSFMSTKHAGQMFTENRFLNVTFAAEAFHEVTQGSPYMEDAEFQALLETYLANTPAMHHDWLLGKVQYGNEPPLRKRLHQLATRSAAATRPIIGEKGRWAFIISRVRNELTHLGSGSRSFDSRHLLSLTESVFAVVRICMLLESGVSIETLTKKADSASRGWYQDRLGRTLQKIWANTRRSPQP
ncbi:HEPN domain-containing protein [Plantactinospora solaniradicis]|uniref:HEPN domain-containing protein n=1 Tax=Plantactinospora solaniradicis TaxID=1723736 RepID=A0ABW1KL66_9ACTN